MRLSEMLKPANVRLGLAAKIKTDAIKELVDLLAANNELKDPKLVLEAVLEREATRTTGIGQGLAIPHGKCLGTDHLVMALGKTAAPIEIVVIDDHSRDGSREFLEQYCQRHSIRLILPERNLGIAGARNQLIRHARGAFIVATPLGCKVLLEAYDIPVEGADVVIVGRSQLVGRPLALLLTLKGAGANATVTLCHTGTPDVGEHTRRADIVVAGAGSANSVTADMVKPGAVVIDCGTNKADDGRTVGDVDFEAVRDVAGAITPVPGGVGPMTVACLMDNVARAADSDLSGGQLGIRDDHNVRTMAAGLVALRLNSDTYRAKVRESLRGLMANPMYAADRACGPVSRRCTSEVGRGCHAGRFQRIG